MSKENVFIILEKKFSADIDTNIFIKDIGTVFCKDANIQRKIEDLKVVKTQKEEDWDYIESTDIANKVLEYDPQLDISMFGATDVLIEIKSKEKDNKLFQFVKVALITIVLFLGAGIAIVNFYEDVNMIASLNKIYYSITGINETKPVIFTIPYTIGLGLGIIAFFSRVISSSERRKKEPGPMEVELYLYDTELEDYILNDIKKVDGSKK